MKLTLGLVLGLAVLAIVEGQRFRRQRPGGRLRQRLRGRQAGNGGGGGGGGGGGSGGGSGRSLYVPDPTNRQHVQECRNREYISINRAGVSSDASITIFCVGKRCDPRERQRQELLLLLETPADQEPQGRLARRPQRLSSPLYGPRLAGDAPGEQPRQAEDADR